MATQAKHPGSIAFYLSLAGLAAGLVFCIMGTPAALAVAFAFFVSCCLSWGLRNDFMDAMVITLVAVGALVAVLCVIDAQMHH
jgi:hypothetical protein